MIKTQSTNKIMEKVNSTKELNHNKRVQNIKQKKNLIDISSQPYDDLLRKLKTWRMQLHATIMKTLDTLLKYRYSCIVQLKKISTEVSTFHKQICKQSQKDRFDTTKVQVDEQYFRKVIELKKKFKKLQKQGCFSGQTKIKKTIQEHQHLKKNLVNVQVHIPKQLTNEQKQQVHKQTIILLYRSFICYYPQSHNDHELNQKTISFIKQLYFLMKKHFYFLKQKSFFMAKIGEICIKLKKQKFKENKQMMLQGKITPRDAALDRNRAWINFQAERKNEQSIERVLRESQIVRI